MKTKLSTYSEIVCSACYLEYYKGETYWVQEHLWCEFTGKRIRYTLCDSSGDHEPVSATEARRIERDAPAEHLAYSRWVLENNGEDPLGEFYSRRTEVVKGKVTVQFSTWIGVRDYGYSVDSVTLDGTLYPCGMDLPTPVLEFFEIEKRKGRMIAPWAKSIAEARAYVKEGGTDFKVRAHGNGFKLSGTAEWTQPRPEETIRAEIMDSARRHIEHEESRAAARKAERIAKRKANKKGN